MSTRIQGGAATAAPHQRFYEAAGRAEAQMAEDARDMSVRGEMGTLEAVLLQRGLHQLGGHLEAYVGAQKKNDAAVDKVVDNLKA